MKLEQAITTAIEFENKVHTTYLAAAEETADPTGKRIFGTLAQEELGHIKYLESCLAKWKESGKLTITALETVIPSSDKIEEGLARLKDRIEERADPRPAEVEHLRRAIRAEMETAEFYRRMVDELAGDEGKLFERFLEIEEGHLAIVNAELDSVSNNGSWFNMPEWKWQDG